MVVVDVKDAVHALVDRNRTYTNKRGGKMAHICPMQGCKEKSGMCKHEKMMLGIVIIVLIIVLYVRLV